MKRIGFLLAATATASLAVSVAIAAPPLGKGKPATTGVGCKPMISVVLKGTLTATPGASATSLSVNVTSGNHFAHAYVAATQPTVIGVGSKTKVRRQGLKTVGDLVLGDRVLVQARVCKAALNEGAMPALTAVRVVAHPAAA